MEILITNVESDPIEIDFDSWNLTRYLDAHRASELRIQCDRKVPVSKFARVEAREDGDIAFRGYIRSPTIKSLNRRELTCKGDEDLLLRRFSGRYSFSANMYHLTHIFEDNAPNQVVDEYNIAGNVGLLFMANSMIPLYGNVISTGTPHYDWFNYDGANKIFKLTGLGLNSRIGSKAIYCEGLLLPRVSTYAEMLTTAMSCYSDASDLYIRNHTYTFNFGPRMMMLAENAYDTNVRRGIIDESDTLLTGNLQMNFNRILDALINIGEYHGLEPRFRYATDGYTYLDILADPVEDEYELSEEYLRDIKQAVANDPAPSALIGLGVGSRDVQHLYAPSDHSWKGVWYEDTFDVPEGFVDALGSLKPTIDAEYARRLNDEIFSVTPDARWPHRPRPGDMVNLRLAGDPSRSLQVASVKRDSKGKLDLGLGGRKDDIIDAFQAKKDLGQIYLTEYMTEIGVPLTASGTLTIGDYSHGWCTGWTFTFTVPASAQSADWSNRVTLDISMNANVQLGTALYAVTLNGVTPNFLMQPRHYLLNDMILRLDITRYVYYGSQSSCVVNVMLMADWLPAHAACANHPTATMNATVRMWQRILPT